MMLNAIPKTYGRESDSSSVENELVTSSGVKTLLNSCLYPSSARGCSSALAIVSLLVMPVAEEGRCGSEDGAQGTVSYRQK